MLDSIFSFSQKCDNEFMKKHLKMFQTYILLWIILIVGMISLFLIYSEIFQNNIAKVIFLDVGQGDSILIITAHGRQILVDAGKHSDISEKIANYIPMSDRSLDMVIATHPDIDHVAGFNTLLDEYQIDYFIHSGLLAGASVYRSIAKKVRKHNISVHAAIAGEKIFLDKNMYLEILSPYKNKKIEDPNDSSVVVHLMYQGHGIMLTGDAPKLVEQNILSLYGSERIRSDILKMGHHGSKTSSDENFVAAVHQKYGIISAGCDNRYGHPHASTLKVLDEQNIQEINTCEHGDIVFAFNNGEWNLEK